MDPVRYSHLKMIGQSPEHYRAAISRQTYAKERGSVLHSLVLGGQRAIAYPGPVRRGKEFDAFKAANPDAMILTGSDYAKAMGMSEAVSRHPDAVALLKGQHEVEIDWQYLGRSCQSHVDVLGQGYITELKSTVSSDPKRFMWQALRLGYGGQCAFYQMAAAFIDRPAEDAYIVAVESNAPHVVTCFKVSDQALEHGRKQIRLWFERLLACEASNEWPGYVGSIVPLDVPEDESFDLGELTYGESEEAA